ncbi:MAG: T9SS type A sorting domain-containing protein [Bacteroidetes bacterium]|nr:T9SS type A sorting domain-containing protein [Bacteroidota bacterium]
MKKRILSILSLILISVLLISWGSTGHKKINLNACLSFNYQMAQFLSWGTSLQNHASDADDRKNTDPNESPKHFIDIDSYAVFNAQHRIPQTWDSINAIYGNAYVINEGILPWATVTTYDTLVKCFQRSDFAKAVLIAADLGHYVGDGHMPLHLTKNYDGQLTNNSGIHSRYESTMITANITQLVYTGDTTLNVIQNINQYVFDYIYNNYKYKDSVLIADSIAKVAGGGSTSSSAYTQSLWYQTKNYTTLLFKNASHRLAELIYTAWVNAGSPSGINEVKTSVAAEFEQNFPNPFANTTTFHFKIIEHNQHIVFQIKDVKGQTIATLKDGNLNTGDYIINWTPANLPDGIYFAVIQSGNTVISQKILHFK